MQRFERRILRGVPPIHRHQLGEQPHVFWLIDSGTTTHMTPFISDLDHDSFVPHKSSIRVANNHRSQSIGTGTVTVTIQDYTSNDTVSLQLFRVLVVPELNRRLISTDALNDMSHEVRHCPSYVSFHLSDYSDDFESATSTIIRFPRWYKYNHDSGHIHWPNDYLTAAKGADTKGIIAAPFHLRPHLFDSGACHRTHNATTADDSEAVTITSVPADIQPTTIPKRQVPMQLMHHRLGHRSFDAL